MDKQPCTLPDDARQGFSRQQLVDLRARARGNVDADQLLFPADDPPDVRLFWDRFENGAIGNIITTFDVWGSTLPRIEVYGTRGSIIVPDPNTFGGEVKLKQYFDKDFNSYPLTGVYSENSRGIGLSDMANCIIEGRSNNRASGSLGLHVLEIMEAIHRSNNEKREIELISTCEKPEPLPITLVKGRV